jgi:ATP-dependent helicase/nuclease subunit A
VLTPEQARAAHSRGSVAVVAGAGTGKTFLLVSRYLYHLDNGLTPLEVVAVTFTEKAAAELRSRIRRKAQHSLSTQVDLLAELEAAQISTIHALAARICRDHPQAAGVPADFTVLDELEADLYQGEWLESALNDLPPETLNVFSYQQLSKLMQKLMSDPIVAERALNVDTEQWEDLVQQCRQSTLTELTRSSDWRKARQVVETSQGKNEDLIEQARLKTLAGLSQLDKGDTSKAYECFKEIKLAGGSKKNWSDEQTLKSTKKAIEILRETVKDAATKGLLTLTLGPADETLRTALATLRETFVRVRDHIARKKFAARKLTFADLEVHALKALQKEEVRIFYRERWKAFLVDEMQDTNPVQAQLLDYLTTDALVMMVGDEKQAIYGFRGADAKVFRTYRDHLVSSGGQSLEVSQSFRTHHALLEKINTCSSAVLKQHHQMLTASRREAPHGEACFEAHRVRRTGENRAARLAAEARMIAGRIKQLLANGLTIFDSTHQCVRPVRPKDIAVLTQTWQPLDLFNEIFLDEGVPVVHMGGGNLLETREAKDALTLLQTLCDARDEIALIATLRSPFFALSDVELYQARVAHKETPWSEIIEQHESPAFARVREVITALKQARVTHSASQILRLADRLTGYTAVLGNLPGASRRLADWEGFIELVQRLEGGLGDVFYVVRRIKKLNTQETNIARPVVHGHDAVSLMTIHKAKGLEWPFVVVADLDYQAGHHTQEVFLDTTLGVALRLKNTANEVEEPALYKILKHQEKIRREEETARLLYVALTRARDHLMLCSSGSSGSFAVMLEETVEQWIEV